MTNDRPKPGYKQTEVGVIPEDWKPKNLGEIFQLGNGFSFKSEFFSSSGPIVLTPGNFKLEGGLYFNDRNTKRYSGSFPESTIFQKGNLLVVMTDLTPDCNLLGKPAFVDSEERILHNQRIGKINLLTEDIDKQFLYFLLLSNPYLKRIKEQATGSTVRHTSNKSIYSIVLPIPQKVEEQRSIAQALSDVDALIAALDKAIAKKRAIKTATMQQLLTGKTRLPGFGEGKGYKESAIGVIPEDWQVKRIKDIAPLQRGFDLPTSKLRRGDYPVAYSNGVMNYHAEFMVQGPGVITGRSGTIGNVHYVSENYWPHNTALWVTAFIDSYPKYIYYFYKFLKLERFGTGSGVPTLNRNDVHDSEVAISGLEEQRAIATVLSDMDTEIAALETRLAKTRSIKQGMMQQLLTGKVRLKIEAGMDAGREDD